MDRSSHPASAATNALACQAFRIANWRASPARILERAIASTHDGIVIDPR
jgi:hypothetical protein